MTDQPRGRVRAEQGHKRVRGYCGGELVVDSLRPVYVWEIPYFPAYYFPHDDIQVKVEDSERVERSPSRGEARYLHLHAGGQLLKDAAYTYPESPIETLRGLVHIDWDAMDEWLEEDEPVYTHPRDPYSRVDILASSRHVRVEVDGVAVAESRQPRLLFETGLPVRFYLPMTDVRLDLLTPSTTKSHCPYKGEASYWSLDLDSGRHDDFVWAYRSPLPESQKVAGLMAFYNEKVDLYVDGVLQERPRSHFS